MLAALALLLTLGQAAPAGAGFEQGKTAYQRREYPRAIQLLVPLVEPEPRLDSEDRIVEARRMLVEAYLFEKRDAEAAAQARKLLQLRPDLRFDPLLEAPELVDLLERVRREQESELAALEEKRRRDDEEQQRLLEMVRRGPTVVERTVVRNSYLLNFVPFGAGQFQNGQPRKGRAFLISEAALAGLSVGMFVANFATYGAREEVPCVPLAARPGGAQGGCPSGLVEDPRNRERSRLMTKVQLASGVAFFAVAAWGIADALIHHRPEVTLETTRPARPEDATRVSLTPLLWRDGAGAGLRIGAR